MIMQKIINYIILWLCNCKFLAEYNNIKYNSKVSITTPIKSTSSDLFACRNAI